jgi:hypothetical protein
MNLVEMIETWSEDRSTAARAVLMLLLASLAVCLTVNHSCWTPFAPLDLVIHEVGHPLFSFFGEWMHYAGGTILQLAVPILAMISLLKQGEYFGLPLGGVWFSVNMFEIARYIADTRAQELPLATLGFAGGEPAEVKFTDWEYLLDRIPGLSMEYDTDVALAVRIAAYILLWGSILLGSWMVWMMFRAKTRSATTENLEQQSRNQISKSEYRNPKQ